MPYLRSTKYNNQFSCVYLKTKENILVLFFSHTLIIYLTGGNILNSPLYFLLHA